MAKQVDQQAPDTTPGTQTPDDSTTNPNRKEQMSRDIRGINDAAVLEALEVVLAEVERRGLSKRLTPAADPAMTRTTNDASQVKTYRTTNG